MSARRQRRIRRRPGTRRAWEAFSQQSEASVAPDRSCSRASPRFAGSVQDPVEPFLLGVAGRHILPPAVGSRGQSRVGNGPGAVTTELRIFDLIRADLLRACQGNQHRTDVFAYLRELFNPGTQAILCYRFGFWARALPVPIVRPLLRIVHFLLEYVFASRVGIHIPIRAEIGPGFVIHTWAGGLIMPGCKVGSNLTLIGGGVQFDWETESIGDDVWLGPGTKFVGKVRVGSRVRTAPNSVVMTDIPDDSTAFGNPARIVPARKWKFAPTGAAQAKAIAARRAQAEATATSAPTPEK